VESVPVKRESEHSEQQMPPGERWLALLQGRSADRVPTDYQATDEVTARLLPDLDCADEAALWWKLRCLTRV